MAKNKHSFLKIAFFIVFVSFLLPLCIAETGQPRVADDYKELSDIIREASASDTHDHAPPSAAVSSAAKTGAAPAPVIKKAVPKASEASNALSDADGPLRDAVPPAGSVPMIPGAPIKKDLKDIKKEKIFRILMLDERNTKGLPRKLSPSYYELVLLVNFAHQQGLMPMVIYVDKFEDLIPSLNSGRGDIIAANLTVTAERQAQINFSIPITNTTEQIVTNARNIKVKSVKDLVSQTIVLEKGTCYWENAKKLQAKIPSIRLIQAPDQLDTLDLLERVQTGKLDFVMSDSNYVDSFDMTSSNMKVVYEFPDKRDIAWGVRTSSPLLLATLNEFLKKEIPQYKKLVFKGDLDYLKDLGIVRILTRNNPSCYYIHRGVLMGYEYELVSEFAKRNGLRPIIIIPPDWNDLIPWLLEGRGDIIAANMAVTDKRKKIAGLSFSEPYLQAYRKIIGRKSEAEIKNLKELSGRTIALRKNSSYWEIMERIRNNGLDIKLKAMPENMETFELIRKVAGNELDLTVADEPIMNIEIMQLQQIRPLINIGEPEKYSWVMRSENTQLIAAVNSFIKKEVRGPFFNTVYNKYFKIIPRNEPKQYFKPAGDRLFAISPYDLIIKKYSKNYGFHWCLIAAQIFHESRFEAGVRAWDGGMGLMQLMPETAKMLGCKNAFEPEENVNAGVKYMAKLRTRMDKELNTKDKLCFTLASYNGGYGHLMDARQLAIELNLNPDKWFGNVEKSMMLLSFPDYAKKAKYGYCAAPIIISYVNNIMLRYYLYLDELQRCTGKTQ